MAKTFCKKCNATINYSITDLSRTLTKELDRHTPACGTVYGYREDYTEAELLEASALIENLLNAPLTRLAILIDWKRSIERARFTGTMAGKVEVADDFDAPMSISSDADGVHAAHCCTLHGCKYGDDDCAVLLQRVAQLYPCEDCEAAKEREALTKEREALRGAEVRNWRRKNVEATPAPDHHNARRLAWREYAKEQHGLTAPGSADWADHMLDEEEKRFGEVK